MEKTGDFKPGISKSDYDMSKTAEYFDKEGPAVADAANLDKLAEPQKIEDGSAQIATQE